MAATASCAVCGKPLELFTAAQRTRHVNRCLDKQAAAAAQPPEDDEDDEFVQRPPKRRRAGARPPRDPSPDSVAPALRRWLDPMQLHKRRRPKPGAQPCRPAYDHSTDLAAQYADRAHRLRPAVAAGPARPPSRLGAGGAPVLWRIGTRPEGEVRDDWVLTSAKYVPMG